ncbi:MAG: pyridoxine 5'-phosphate synthase [Myxococcota bacterium]
MEHTTLSRLSVNVNAIAYLRNRRDLPWPDLLRFARIAMDAGARGITVHPRPDERHIRRSDVRALAALFRDAYPDRDLSLEGYPDDDFLALVEEVRPRQVLYVPDAPEQSTSDHGWDLDRAATQVEEIVRQTQSWDVLVSLFVDPEPRMAERAKELGADRIEIFTGPYGACYADAPAAAEELNRVVKCAEAGRAVGLGVNAGHDLTLENLGALIARAPFIREVSIGHAFMSTALEVGFAAAVRRFRVQLGEVDEPTDERVCPTT